MGKKRIKTDIKKLRQMLESSSLNIKMAFLFGSRAKGDFLKESDWDILIVSPDFAGIPFPERATLVLKKLPLRRVELFCYSEEEFNQKAKEIGIIKEALKGKRII